jgi:uncharacterized membrane protein
MLVNESSKASPANLQHLKRSMLAAISALLCFLGMLPTTAHATSYTWRLLRGTAQQARHPIGPFSKSSMARIMALQPVTW